MPVGWPISQFLSYPISFLFPGYKSFLAVMSEAGDDDTRWLCYWVLCGLLFFFEAALSVVPEHFPLYYELKCLVLLFLQYDTAKPAYGIYMKYVAPVIKRAEPAIDKFIESYSQQAVKIEHRVKEEAAKQMLNAAIEQATNQ